MALEKGKVELEKYNPEWVNMYNDEEILLTKLIGNEVGEIMHVGSTSIVGLSAKPVIDIMVTVDKLGDVLKFREKFSINLGYDFRDDGGIKGEYLVRKGPEEARTHFIHIIEKKSSRYDEFVMFKKYLNKHPERIEMYQKIKENLAIKYKDNRKNYTTEKNDFIKETIELCKQEI